VTVNDLKHSTQHNHVWLLYRSLYIIHQSNIQVKHIGMRLVAHTRIHVVISVVGLFLS